MNSVTTNTVDILGEGAISPTAVEEAVFQYRKHFQHYPDELVMHPAARYAFIEQRDTHDLQDLNTYHGMNIVMDRQLDEAAWLVRRSESITRTLP